MGNSNYNPSHTLQCYKSLEVPFGILTLSTGESQILLLNQPVFTCIYRLAFVRKPYNSSPQESCALRELASSNGNCGEETGMG